MPFFVSGLCLRLSLDDWMDSLSIISSNLFLPVFLSSRPSIFLCIFVCLCFFSSSFFLLFFRCCLSRIVLLVLFLLLFGSYIIVKVFV